MAYNLNNRSKFNRHHYFGNGLGFCLNKLNRDLLCGLTFQLSYGNLYSILMKYILFKQPSLFLEVDKRDLFW